MPLHCVWLMLTIACTLSGCLVQQIGGAFSQEPETLPTQLSQDAQTLLQEAFVGIEKGRLTDYHVHLLGLGTDHTGAFVNPQMQSWQSPFARMKFKIYASAAGIKNLKNADQEYVERLVRLIENVPQHDKYYLFAFDKFYEPDGTVNLEKTQFYVPNDYAFRLSQQYPALFRPTISVHPYRPDAIEVLQKWSKQGVRFVKWLPNSMGIDPSHEGLQTFYETMKAHQMVLLTHTGKEQAIEAPTPEFGNPLLLKRPLELGLRVVMLHSATLGHCKDLENLPQTVPCFDLFLRMMEKAQYKNILLGEISAVTQANRPISALKTLIERQDLHPRLINGSDYPLPAVNFLIRTQNFVKAGMLTQEQGKSLKEIYQFNPLLFDFVLKRTLTLPQTGQKFSPSIFMRNPRLE